VSSLCVQFRDIFEFREELFVINFKLLFRPVGLDEHLHILGDDVELTGPFSAAIDSRDMTKCGSEVVVASSEDDVDRFA
jgi:hypothetical protein